MAFANRNPFRTFQKMLKLEVMVVWNLALCLLLVTVLDCSIGNNGKSVCASECFEQH